MKFVKLIYNPYSGEKNFKFELDEIIKEYQKKSYTVIPKRISSSPKYRNFESGEPIYDHILIAGGDGTINRVVKDMKKMGLDYPIGLYPIGTANDYAKMLGMERDVVINTRKILNAQTRYSDIGMINGEYFVNVASAGIFTNVSQKIDDNLKESLGKVGYYMRGIAEIPNFKPFDIKITHDNGEFNGSVALFLIFNGKTAGNMKLGYKSEFDDGYLDVVIVKNTKLAKYIELSVNVIKGDFLDKEEKENVIEYIRTKNIKIEISSESKVDTDVDGERGPEFPLEIKCLEKAIRVKY